MDYSDDDSNMSVTLNQEETTSVPLDRPSKQERTKAWSPTAWSPSRPVVDSSDGASDASEQPLMNLEQVFSYNRPSASEEPEILSTYRPTYEQNMFRLSLDEGSALGLSGLTVVLVLSPSATVSFVGAYQLRVLRGSISLLGTTIQPSQVLHRVFAPWSSPIPIIEALVAHGESSKSLFDIPSRIMGSVDAGDVVIVVQELRTGIENLGRVIRTFEGVFDQASSEGVPDIPLEGIHLVSHSFSEDACFAHIAS